MKRTNLCLAMLTMTTLLAACHQEPQSTATPAPTVATISAAVSPTVAPTTADDPAAQWLGKWVGPEGTFLLLARKGDKYAVQIQSLDGLQTYDGTWAGDHIAFTRDGKSETIRAGNGEATGMKWLLDKTDCLVIKKGEGFCRK